MHTAKIIISILIILSFILSASIIGANSLRATSDKLEGHIAEIEESTLSGNWDKAKENVDSIEKTWSKAEGTWTILLDHAEIDNIDNSLSRMKKYIDSQDRTLALGELANLHQYVKHIPQMESLNLRNIF